jgi:hypothetical protein
MVQRAAEPSVKPAITHAPAGGVGRLHMVGHLVEQVHALAVRAGQSLRGGGRRDRSRWRVGGASKLVNWPTLWPSSRRAIATA